MRYVFKVLIVGEPRPTYEYVLRAFQEECEIKEAYLHEWFKEINALEDVCDLEVDVLTDVIAANYDEIMPMVDGIIYIMNPMNIEEYELFQMNLSIIKSVKRNIPIILVFYDKKGILPFITNEFLESFWYEYPELEAFINLPPAQFHQALECLCLAMIAGDTPLNIENAWLRFPIFIELANKYFSERNYYYAAQVMKKASLISEIYENNEFYIYCEQTAFLFAQVNLYLEASYILNKFDKKRSSDFKESYHKAMIKEGNILFKKGEYESAAPQYERAAQWASIELEERSLVSNSFKLAINSWISACKTEVAFKILERLPHEEKGPILVEISDKIVEAADFLISEENLTNARDQLYYTVNTYQREGQFDVLKKFTKKLIEILTTILEQKINEKDSYAAKSTYDEIENLWDTFGVEKIDVDYILEKLIRILLEELNFGLATVLINKLNSLELKKNLTDYSIKIDEKTKKLKRKEITEYLQQGVGIIKEFVDSERDIVTELNIEKIKESETYIKKKDSWNAAKIIKNQAIFLKNIGKEEIGDQILTKSLDILIEGKLFDKFFKFHSDLTDDVKGKYLMRISPIFIEKLKELKFEKDYEKKSSIFELSNKKFRNAELYDESKEISKLFIKEIKKEAFRVVEVEENVSSIEKSTGLIKKINGIISAYFDKDKDKLKIDFDKIYKKISEIYISIEDFSSAQAFTDKIENKMYKDELHKKFAKLETKKARIKTRIAEESLKAEILKERLSFIKKKGKDAQHDRESELKQRIALKRTYYNEALDFLKRKEFDSAISSYKKSILRLNKIKKYDLAGVSLAVASLLLMKNHRIIEMIELIKEIENELSNVGKLFSETFSVTLLDYIVDLEKLEDDDKLREALSYLEYLPLFDEELKVLYEYLGKEIEIVEVIEKKELEASEIAAKRSEISKLAKEIKKEQEAIARRKMMKRDYWKEALEQLNNNDLQGAFINYTKVIPKLLEKRFLKQALISLILGTLIQIYETNSKLAKTNFNDNVKKNWNIKELETFPEYKIMNYVFHAFENNSDELIKFTLDYIAEKLILFEPEIKFIKILSGEEIFEEKIEEEVSVQESEELSKLKLELDYVYSNLKQQIGDIKSESKDFFTKRKAMKKRYYDKILVLLKSESFEETSSEYLSLSSTLLKRKDYRTSSLLLLLYGLSLIKDGDSPEQLHRKVAKFLKSVGLNEKILKDTYYVTLLQFIIDVKIKKMDQYNQNIKELLEIIPIFEEEKELIKITE